jgi:hypothetical protein
MVEAITFRFHIEVSIPIRRRYRHRVARVYLQCKVQTLICPYATTPLPAIQSPNFPSLLSHLLRRLNHGSCRSDELVGLLLIHLRNALLFGDFAGCTHIYTAVPGQWLVENLKQQESKIYHAMTAKPRRAEIQLKTRATIPRAVNPAGKGPGGALAPVKSKKLTVFAAALPALDILPALQASRWF